jgi:hypothetical protein
VWEKKGNERTARQSAKFQKSIFYTSSKRITKWWPQMQMQQPRLDSWACPTPGLRVVLLLLRGGWWTDKRHSASCFSVAIETNKIAAQSSVPHPDPLPLGFPDPVIINCGSAFGSVLFQHYSVLAPPRNYSAMRYSKAKLGQKCKKGLSPSSSSFCLGVLINPQRAL